MLMAAVISLVAALPVALVIWLVRRRMDDAASFGRIFRITYLCLFIPQLVFLGMSLLRSLT
jgi:maltodextrin utilization protein YvdJ